MLFLATAAPVAAQATWRLDATMPSRGETPICYDVQRDQMLLFGGFDQGYFDDTCRWTGSLWERLSPTSHPSPRRGHGMVYDSSQNRILLYGGTNGSIGFNDLWAWTGTDWQQIATPHSPPTGAPSGMAFDTLRSRVVLFGSASYRNDFWEFDGADWTNVTPAGSLPSAQNRAAIAFDPVAGKVVLFESGDSRRMWTFDGTNLVFTTVSGFASPFRISLVYDSLRQRLVSAGGVHSATSPSPSYLFDRGSLRWTQLTTDGPMLESWGAAYDSRRDRIVFLAMPSATTLQAGGTWELHDVSWQRVIGDTPVARAGGRMVWDGRRVLLYGGRGNMDHSDTWQLQDGAWTLLVPEPQSVSANHPRDLVDFGMALDPLHEEAVLVAGRGHQVFDFWRFVANQWQQVNTAHTPSARYLSAVVRDIRRHRLVLFGGCTVSGSQHLNDTWIYDGTDWTQLTTATTPSAHDGHQMAYDECNDQVVVVGGNVVGGSPQDTWVFDGSDWRLRAAASPLPSDLFPMLTYDRARQRLVAVCTTWSAARLEVWEWDGADWRPRPTPSDPPGARNGQIAATDTGVVLFSGGHGNSLVSWQWILASDHLAAATAFAAGCSNANGTPALRVDRYLPWSGFDFELTLGPLQSGPLVLPGLWFGWSRLAWQGQPLPFDLGVVGFPGCAIAIAPDSPFPILNQGNGYARATVHVPAAPELIGANLFLQGFDFDPFAAALSMSQGIELIIGAR